MARLVTLVIFKKKKIRVFFGSLLWKVDSKVDKQDFLDQALTISWPGHLKEWALAVLSCHFL